MAPRARHHRPPTPALINRDVANGSITRAQGARYMTYALTASWRVPAAYRSLTPWDGTVPLLQLQLFPSSLVFEVARPRRSGRGLQGAPCGPGSIGSPTFRARA